MKEFVIYSAIFGGKDCIQNNQFKIPGADYVMFTEDTTMQSDIWDVRVVIQDRWDPHRTSRFYKLLPHLKFPDYKYSLWIDGNRVIQKDVYRLMKSWMGNAVLVNPVRSKDSWKKNAYDEAAHCIALGKKGNFKDDPEIINKQTQAYIVEGLPMRSGLWGCQYILREHNHPDCIKLSELWWQQIKKYSKRDQISFPYCVWKTGTYPASIPAKKLKDYIRAEFHVK